MVRVLRFYNFLKQVNIFYYFFSDVDDNDKFTLRDGILFEWKKQQNMLKHAYAVTTWALSLQPEIQAECIWWPKEVGGWGGFTASLSAIMSKQESWIKVLIKWLIFFGKTSNISLTELVLTVIVQVALKMIMPSLVDLNFGMRCIFLITFIGTRFCCLSNHIKTSWNMICRVALEWCEEYQEREIGKYWQWIIRDKGHFYISAKLEDDQLLRVWIHLMILITICLATMNWSNYLFRPTIF